MVAVYKRQAHIAAFRVNCGLMISRIIAWIVAAFWFVSVLAFVVLPYFFVPLEHQISGEGGRFSC